MKTYRIHLIRHAEIAETAQGKYIGHTDVSLPEDSKEKARRLASDKIYPYADAVFTSPLKRCTETAAILYPDIKAVPIEELIECNFGEFEGKTADDLRENEDFAGWLAGKNAPPFGESSRDFGARVITAFEKIADGMMKSGVPDVAIITHAGVMSAILAAYGIPEAPMHEWITPNCCGYSVRLDPSIWMRGKKFEVYSKIPENWDE